MRPGIVNYDPKLNAGENVVVIEEKYGKALAIGKTLCSGAELSIKKEGDSLRLVFEYPTSLKNYLAYKGSICIDGVSLTVNEVNKENFKVNIIGYTKRNTTFKNIKIGDLLNTEIDMLARYVYKNLR